jgi:hypothetical protein
MECIALRDRMKLVSRMPPQSICAEIGVKFGDFAKIILEHSDPKELHLIDPWEAGHTWGHRHIVQQEWDEEHAKMLQWAEEDPRVKVHRGLSADVLPTFPDSYFDWVYVDANHSFENVTEDLDWSYRKVKRLGFVLGHDFDRMSVKLAVFNAMNKRRFRMRFLTRECEHCGHPSFGLRVLKSLSPKNPV